VHISSEICTDFFVKAPTLNPPEGGGIGVIVLYSPLTTADTLNQANEQELEYLNYRVEKMRCAKNSPFGGKGAIIYNSQITIENIPAEAYEYVVNGKSAIEWITERYKITTHKDSGIVNNPNDWSRETGNPRYILDLLLSVINVSVQTVENVKSLPEIRFESEENN
jgi:predicted helicase